MPVPLGEDVPALLRRPSTCYIATTMPDGSPQLTQTWVDTDGEHVLINSVESHPKTRTIARDPRVAVAVADPSDQTAYVQIRGRVVRVDADGGREAGRWRCRGRGAGQAVRRRRTWSPVTLVISCQKGAAVR